MEFSRLMNFMKYDVSLRQIKIYRDGVGRKDNITKKEKFTDEYIELYHMSEKNDFYHIAVIGVDEWRSTDAVDAYVVELRGEKIGFVMAKVANIRTYYWMNFLLIDKKYRGYGFGTQILNQFQELCISRGLNCCADIDIQVPRYMDKAPKLIRWYKHNGFSVDGIGGDGNLMMVKVLV